jgi:hypothetical protein
MAEWLGGLVKWLDGLAAWFCQVAEDCSVAGGGSSREDNRPLPLYAVARLRGCAVALGLPPVTNPIIKVDKNL